MKHAPTGTRALPGAPFLVSAAIMAVCGGLLVGLRAARGRLAG